MHAHVTCQSVNKQGQGTSGDMTEGVKKEYEQMTGNPSKQCSQPRAKTLMLGLRAAANTLQTRLLRVVCNLVLGT